MNIKIWAGGKKGITLKYNPEIYNRKSIRLKQYDYSKEGMYFITICTKNRENLFGTMMPGSVKTDPYVELNELGIIVENELNCIPKHFKHVKIQQYVIMPNHVHFIIEIVGVGLDQPSSKIAISAMIGLYKSGVTRIFNKKHKCNMPIWQRNYYEHIIRNEKEYYQICEYIKQNPLKWINKP